MHSCCKHLYIYIYIWRDCIVAGMASTNAVSTYDHLSFEMESHPCRIALEAIVCDIFFRFATMLHSANVLTKDGRVCVLCAL